MSPSRKWKRSYSVGHAVLDEQHDQLLQIIADLEDAVARGASSAEVSTAVEALITYARTHFAVEERLQVEKGYPGHELHKREHERFAAECEKLRTAEPTPELAGQILRRLREWLSAHILELDKDFGRYLL